MNETPTYKISPEPTLQLTDLRLILTRMFLKRQIKAESFDQGAGKRMKWEYDQADHNPESGKVQATRGRGRSQKRASK